jgi:uncharacterized RDD family membrane protein YckC
MTDEHRYAGFILRLFASGLDAVILFLIGMSLLCIQIFLFPFSITPESLGLDFGLNSNTMGALLISQFIVWGMYMLPIFWLYSALLESSSLQGTIGKIALKLMVCDKDGRRISFLRASLRFIGKIVSALPLFIGFFLIALTERKQGLDDFLAGTQVLHQPEPDGTQDPSLAKDTRHPARQATSRDSNLAWFLIIGCILVIFFGPMVLSGIMLLSFHPPSSGSISSGPGSGYPAPACTIKEKAPFPEVKNWTLAVRDTPFDYRVGAGFVEHDGKLWMAGGYTPLKDFNDVWVSPDGIQWEQVTPHAAFSPRAYQGFLSYNGRMWVIGGNSHNETGFYKTEKVCDNDVWSSSDGVTWTRVTPDTGFPPRCEFQSVVYDNRMWVIGGSRTDKSKTGPALYSDIWSSTDGITWTQSVPSDNFKPFYVSAVFVFDNSLWLSEGNIWRSNDGITWKTVSKAQGYSPPISTRRVFVYNNTIFLLDDSAWGSLDSSPIWYSADGSTWTQFCPEFSVLSKRGTWITGGVIFNNRLWIISDNELWHSGN